MAAGEVGGVPGSTSVGSNDGDFDVNAIWRYLAVDELNFNTETGAIDRTTNGGHGYVQLALTALSPKRPPAASA